MIALKGTKNVAAKKKPMKTLLFMLQRKYCRHVSAVKNM